jgi:pimeloyl-ACP methyl ester carboxylesterase
MMNPQSPLSWVRGYFQRGTGRVPNTYIADYSLVDLIRKGYIPSSDGQRLLAEGGLQDFFWQMTWPEDFETPDDMLETNLRMAQGFAVFIHGWTGNHNIWEEIPDMTVLSNRQLIALSVDHNGFGRSPLIDSTPELESVNPPACMSTIQNWIDLLKIRRQPGDTTLKVINLVGHSMGGATLFYLNPIHWRFGEETRLALAPALLLEDELYRAFFTTLGIGIGILERFRGLDFIGNAMKPTVIRTLCEGATEYVIHEHSQQYEETARGVTGATFMAMGRLKNREIAQTWDTFRVVLGHKDRLVGLTGMMDLLGKMEFPVANVRVVPGSHYFFSVGTESPHNAFLHAQNRELVVKDILELHKQAYEMQRKGKKIG